MFAHRLPLASRRLRKRCGREHRAIQHWTIAALVIATIPVGWFGATRPGAPIAASRSGKTLIQWNVKLRPIADLPNEKGSPHRAAPVQFGATFDAEHDYFSAFKLGHQPARLASA